MLFDNIKIGNRIEISLPTESNIEKSHVSQVEEIIGKNRLLIHMPLSYGEQVKLKTNEPYIMLFFTDKGMFQFNAQVLSYEKEGDIHFMEVEITSDGERIQRREFYRFPCLLPLKFAVIDQIANTEDIKSSLCDGIIKDIGGGGIRFISNVDMEEKSLIRCIMMLSDECIIVDGTALYKQHFPKSNYKFQYRVMFVGQIQNQQEKIIQFIFNEQRKILAKVKS